jgi:TPP-dependent 2-oxoacid decarboxylase
LDDEVDRTLKEPLRTEKYVGQVIPMDMKKEPQHCEVTMPREEKNPNEKRMTETKLTRKKSRKLMKKKEKLEKLQNIP